MRAGLVLGAVALLAASAARAEAPLAPRPRQGPPVVAGTVTFVAGEAAREWAGSKAAQALAAGAAVYEGDVLSTARRTRLEVKLRDGSYVRLGPASRALLEVAVFGKGPSDRKVSARLAVGNAWAKVAHAVGGDARFEIQTENAVAGVRGTTFRVDAAKDRSVVVRVYSGTVAVAGGGIPRPEHAGPAPERREVPGPSEVTREEWERIVTRMMLVRVSPDGTAGEPEAFAEAPEDEWERWNVARDAQAP